MGRKLQPVLHMHLMRLPAKKEIRRNTIDLSLCGIRDRIPARALHVDTNCDRNLQSTSHLSQASGHNSAAHAGTQTHMMSTMGVEVELHVGQCGIKRASLPEVRFAEWLAATTNRHMLEGPGTRPLGPHFDLHPQLHPIAQHLQWAWVQIHPPSCSCALAKGMNGEG
jgi:hypothetical protein